MRHRLFVLVSILFAVGTASRARGQAPQGRASAAGLRLPAIFGDGAVLQRGKPITVWGWGTPGASVTAAFRSTTRRATADAAGKWRVTFPALAAGGPFLLSVIAGADRIERRDILVGDVWLASGQSNMEFELKQSRDGAHEIAAAHDPRQREFKIPNSWSMTPEAELTGGSWADADPEHAGAFSAVAYYFARELRKSTGVPIGIINSTWGGSNIETWISRSAQGGFTDSSVEGACRSERNARIGRKRRAASTPREARRAPAR